MKLIYTSLLSTMTLVSFSQTPLSGIYIVTAGGPDEDYATLSEAIHDLQDNGVGAGIQFSGLPSAFPPFP